RAARGQRGLSRLPAYHLRRPRLTDQVAEASVGVVVGGAGYGKSVLAAEACDRLGVAAVMTALEPDASRARSAGGRVLATEQLTGGGVQVLTGLVDQILRSLPRRHQAAMIQAAHLPLLDDGIAEAATGVAGLLAAAGRAGLPLQDSGDGWVQPAGPVRELLMARAPAQPPVLARAAAQYLRRGRPELAAGLLIGAGQASDAAALVAGMSPQQAERVGLDELPRARWPRSGRPSRAGRTGSTAAGASSWPTPPTAWTGSATPTWPCATW